MIGDVVYGVDRPFDKRLGRIPKVNPSRPAVEDAKGNRSCFWKLKLKNVGTESSRFGYCPICGKPSEYALPCPYGAPGGKLCPGIIWGSLSWKLPDMTPPIKIWPKRVETQSIGLFLARQFGAVLKRLGFSELPEELTAAVRERE